MKEVIAFEAEDGSIHKTRGAAIRRDNASLIIPLQKELEKLQVRAKEAGLGMEYALLEFVRTYSNAIQVFFVSPEKDRK